MHASHKVEEQRQNKPFEHEFSKPPIQTQPLNRGSSNFPPRQTPQMPSTPVPQRIQTPQRTQPLARSPYPQPRL